jgi:hypothetical protein
MKLYTELVICKTCPHRCEMKDLRKDGWDSKYENRFVCYEGDEEKEIKLHDTLEAPDWCPLQDWDEKHGDKVISMVTHIDSLDEIINRLQMADGEGVSEEGQPLISLREALRIVDAIKEETKRI